MLGKIILVFLIILKDFECFVSFTSEQYLLEQKNQYIQKITEEIKNSAINNLAKNEQNPRKINYQSQITDFRQKAFIDSTSSTRLEQQSVDKFQPSVFESSQVINVFGQYSLPPNIVAQFDDFTFSDIQSDGSSLMDYFNQQYRKYIPTPNPSSTKPQITLDTVQSKTIPIDNKNVGSTSNNLQVNNKNIRLQKIQTPKAVDKSTQLLNNTIKNVTNSSTPSNNSKIINVTNIINTTNNTDKKAIPTKISSTPTLDIKNDGKIQNNTNISISPSNLKNSNNLIIQSINTNKKQSLVLEIKNDTKIQNNVNSSSLNSSKLPIKDDANKITQRVENKSVNTNQNILKQVNSSRLNNSKISNPIVNQNKNINLPLPTILSVRNDIKTDKKNQNNLNISANNTNNIILPKIIDKTIPPILNVINTSALNQPKNNSSNKNGIDSHQTINNNTIKIIPQILNLRSQSSNSKLTPKSSPAPINYPMKPQNQNKSQFQIQYQNKPKSSIQTQTISSGSPAFNITNNSKPFYLTFTNKPSTIVNKQFSGVGLYHNVPTNFTIGELFKFNGVVLRPDLLISEGAFNYNFLNIVFSAWGGNQFRCTQPLTKTNLEFQISCKMEKQGRFFLSIFPGARGQSSRNMRIIQNQIDSIFSTFFTQPPTPVNLKLDVIDNFLVIQWGSEAALTNLTIYQNQSGNQKNKKQFLLSNYHQKFRVPYSQFKSFEPKTTYIQISHANSKDGTLCKMTSQFSKQTLSVSFQAINHAFDRLTEDKVKINPPIPWRLNIGQKMKFTGVFYEPFKNQVLIIMPNRKIFTVWFIRPDNNTSGNKTISPGTQVSLQLTFSFEGTYIIQINAASGLALVNRPIYVGNGYPLLPDHQDLITPSKTKQSATTPKTELQAYVSKTTSMNRVVNQPPPTSSQNSKIQFMLLLLNALRQSHGVGPVSLSSKLNTLAQYHSDDMDRNNFFSHTSLNGDGPGERAKKMGITAALGQNIVQANSLIQAHLNLQRSADHLENSIKSQWTRVGIGITRTNIGQYLVALQFSTRDLKQNPLNASQIENQRQKVINLVRNTNGGLGFSKQITDDITTWINGSRNVDILQYLIKERNYKGSITYTSFYMSYSDDWVDRLKTAGYVSSKFSNYKRFGIGLIMKKDDPNLLDGYAVFN